MPEVTDNHQQAELAKRIKSARLTCRLSQVVLARQIGVSDKSISAYELGRSTPPFDKLKKIAMITNHPLSYFTEDDNSVALISSKLVAIEQELIEVKKLLMKRYKQASISS